MFDQQVTERFEPPAIAQQARPEVDRALPFGHRAIALQMAGKPFLRGEQGGFGGGEFGQAPGVHPPGQSGGLTQVDIERGALQPVHPSQRIDRLARQRDQQAAP